MLDPGGNKGGEERLRTGRAGRQPGARMQREIEAPSAMRVDVEFLPDFQLMWPASIGTSYSEWNQTEKIFYFGADGQPFAAVFGSPDAVLLEREYGSNYSSETRNSFTLGTGQGRGRRGLARPGSVQAPADAV